MSKTLSLGDDLPDLKLRNQNNDWIDLGKFKGRQPLVIYFYPKDETPGCIREACGFRDHFEQFEKAGAKVFGISGDSVRSHQKFREKYGLKFDLLSDPDRSAEKTFGVPRNLFGLLPGRVTFVFDQKGKLIHEFNSATRATHHIRESLRALKTG